MSAANAKHLENLNINISAYRVLYILLLLVQYRSLNTLELNRFLHENPLIGRSYNTETLTKYINTLREVGCEIPRSSSRNDYCYELMANPFPLKLEEEEQAIAAKLLGLLAQQPDETLYEDYQAFLSLLAWAAGQDAEQLQSAPQPEKPDLSNLDTRRQQLQTYRAYCREAFTLSVQYTDEQKQTVPVLFEPHDLVEQGKRLLLVGVDRESQRQRVLDVDRILSTKQLPAKSRRSQAQTTVTFALYGRLARNYRLYPDEKVVYQKPDELHVRAKVNEPGSLVNRLLKYGPSCQVLSPQSVRNAMKERIDHLLETL